MHQYSILLIALLSTVRAAPLPALRARMDQLIAKSPALVPAFIGMRVVSLRDGSVLYERNGDRLFVPASNTKLFTTALALMRLGPEFHFKTRIFASQPVNAAGHLVGDLTFVGSGDPSMSGRSYPYQKRAPGTAPGADYSFGPIEDLADQIVSAGVKQMDGDVVGDDRHFLWAPYGDGWSTGDPLFEYGAPVSALILDDNSFALVVRPGERPGDLAQITFVPPFEYFTINNQVRTASGGERKIEVDRPARSGELHVWGTIPVSDAGRTELLAVDDPARFAAEALRDALTRRGVAIRGRVIARHRFYNEAPDPGQGDAGAAEIQTGVELAQRVSPPLSQLLQVVDKVSQNLHAEVMLREVGAVRRNMGSREAGLAEMKTFLEQADISKDALRLSDGSGLSRNNLVTPTAVTKLLAFMYNSNYRELWTAWLPTGGADGTLSTRFEGRAEARQIHAKTGSLSHVRALSGYADSKQSGPVAFSILVNHFDAPAAEITRFLDAAALQLLK